MKHSGSGREEPSRRGCGKRRGGQLSRRVAAWLRLLLLTLALAAAAQSRSAAAAVFAVEPAAQVLLVEELSEALCPWYRDGARGLPLVYLGDRPAFFSGAFSLERDAAALRQIVEAGDCGRLSPRVSGLLRADTLWTAGDFALAASRLGVVSELWWVMPSRDPLPAEKFESFKGWLRDTFSLPQEFTDSLEYDGKIVRGTFLGLAVRLVVLGDLPAFEKPVLLGIDTGFFMRLYDNPVREGLLDILGGFLATLKARGVRGERVAVAAGGGTPLLQRYLGPRLRDLFARPGDFGENIPEGWKLQGRFEYLEFMLARDAAVAAAVRLAELEPRSPVPWYDRAVLAVVRKNPQEAQEMLEEAIGRDSAYIAGYRALAEMFLGMEMHGEGLAFLRGGFERHPGDVLTGLALANVLASRGENDQEREILGPLAERNPLLPDVHLALALSLMASGKIAGAGEAMEHFRKTAPPGLWRTRTIAWWESGRERQ